MNTKTHVSNFTNGYIRSYIVSRSREGAAFTTIAKELNEMRYRATRQEAALVNSVSTVAKKPAPSPQLPLVEHKPTPVAEVPAAKAPSGKNELALVQAIIGSGFSAEQKIAAVKALMGDV